jgi:hypothetical protein
MARTFLVPKDGQERHYTLLSIGSHALLLPQSEIRILAPVQDIKIVGQGTSRVIGWLPFAGRHWPVYCLDETLHPLPHLPSGQRICTLIKLNTSYFGLVCTHVAPVQGSALRIWPVPTAMAKPDSPLRGLSRYGEQVVLLSTAAALAVLLGVSDAAKPARQA